MTVSHVARLHGINANQLFKWCKQYENGSLTAVASGEEVVPASELAAPNKQTRELQLLLGKKTMEAEILKEAVEFGRAKEWIAHTLLLPGDDDYNHPCQIRIPDISDVGDPDLIGPDNGKLPLYAIRGNH